MVPVGIPAEEVVHMVQAVVHQNKTLTGVQVLTGMQDTAQWDTYT
jgi:hypothetical protein